MTREKWNLNPERWNRRQKTEGEVITSTVFKGLTEIGREGAKLWLQSKQADADVAVEEIALKRTITLEEGRKHESENQTKVAMAEIEKEAEKAKDEQVTKREKNNKKYENQKMEIEKKYQMVGRYFDHLERQDEMECKRLEEGKSHSVAYIHGSSDAVVMGLMGMYPAPRQVAASPQLPAPEMPQANSSSNSSNSMVPHK